MKKDCVELNKSISFANGGTKFSDLDEGYIYEFRNGIKPKDWHNAIENAKEWVNRHSEDIEKFKKKFGFSTLQK